MSFFEDAMINAKNITAAVGEKTGRVVDISRLRLSAAEINREITKRYEALGRVVYDARKAETDIKGLVDECVRSIDALYARLDDVNAKIAKLKDKKYCSLCGAMVERTSLYCSRCGNRIEREDASSAAKPAASPEASAEADDAADIAAQAVDVVEDIIDDVDAVIAEEIASEE
ncbi:MAG: hypothetical protein IJC18_06220 [Clostridia bacterium]|nr:hypothetical protein [Clostridia bacterium]MBQ9994134.1 hypothetical protein [Clostridia bacterium]